MKIFLSLLFSIMIVIPLYPSDGSNVKQLDKKVIDILEWGNACQLAECFNKIKNVNIQYKFFSGSYTPLEIVSLGENNQNKIEKIEWLTAHSAQVTDNTLYASIDTNGLEILEYLLPYTTSYSLNSGLRYAIAKENLAAVKLLYNYKINTKNVNNTLLNECVNHKNSDIFEYLLNQGLTINNNKSDSQTILHDLANNEHGYILIECLFRLNTLNGLVNDQDGHGDTPLHIASGNGDYKNVYALLAYPLIDLTLKNNSQKTVFKLAKWASKKKSGKVLHRYQQIKNLLTKPTWGHPTQHLSIPLQLPSEIAALVAYHATEEVISRITEQEKNIKINNLHYHSSGCEEMPGRI